MGKRGKRAAQLVKRRSKARKLKKKLNHSLQQESGEETPPKTDNYKESSCLESEDHTTSSSSCILESEYEHTDSFSPQSQNCVTSPPRSISSHQKQASRLHKLLITAAIDPLVVGLKMMNDLEFKKKLLSQSTNIFNDPNSRNKPF